MSNPSFAPSSSIAELWFAPLDAWRWADFEALFGPRGACGGCWCMTPRITARDYEAQKGDGNRAAMSKLVSEGPPPGLLGYRGERPVAWISVEPRTRFIRLAHSRILAPVDEREVWSITCLFIAREERGRGTSVRALEAAAQWAQSQGSSWIEGYPIDPRPDQTIAAAFAYTGIKSAFLAAQFHEVARRSTTRPIMRRELQPT